MAGRRLGGGLAPGSAGDAIARIGAAYEEAAARVEEQGFGSWPAQIVPNLIFSQIAYKFPRSKWVFAETGIGSVSCVQTACDHEWERRQLWRH